MYRWVIGIVCLVPPIAAGYHPAKVSHRGQFSTATVQQALLTIRNRAAGFGPQSDIFPTEDYGSAPARGPDALDPKKKKTDEARVNGFAEPPTDGETSGEPTGQADTPAPDSTPASEPN